MQPDFLLTLPFRIGSTVVAGAVTYLLTCRDFGRRGTALATAGCVVLVGASSAFSPLFPFFVFLAAAAVHLAMRGLLPVGPALAVSAVVLVGGLVGCLASSAFLAFSFPVGSTVFAGVLTYRATRKDFGGRVSALATAGCVVLMGAGSWLAPFFAFFPFLVAAAAYLVVRHLYRVGPALVASAVILVGGLAGSVLMMVAALNGM
ncbi:hypothetical protein ACFQ16_02900 [Saccharopolyspora rosea]|uniref:Uncharacterized protein n=1 Tax=Saccharopolyspora rosea TaxID=524884 RepID=A0ABW3FM31_9PSEU